MSGIWAVATTRFRAGVAGRLPWLIGLVFLVALSSRWWVGAPTEMEAAAQADRALLTLVVALSVLVAAVPAAIGLPFDIRKGSTNALLACPVTRFQVVCGEVLGSGGLACLLAFGMAGASLVGLELTGVGGAVREPVRSYTSVDLGDEERPIELSRAAGHATLPFTVPAGLDREATLRVRIRPQLIHQSGGYPFSESCRLAVGRPGVAGEFIEAQFGMNVPFDADVPLIGLRGGERAELSISGGQGAWKLRLKEVSVAGPPHWFTLEVLLGMACLAPLLFLSSGAALIGAVRFGAPTAAGLVLALVLLFGAQDILEVSARYVVESAEELERAHAGHDHSHGGHDHGPAEITPLQEALARGALSVLTVVPRLDTFDRTSTLADRRASSAHDVGKAAWSAALPLAVFLLSAWCLFRRREMIPR